MRQPERFFSQGDHDWFSPSLHWQHCLLLENELLEFIKLVPIDPSAPKENFGVSSPALVDIFSRSCFLLEAAFKGISKDPTDRIVNFLQNSPSTFSKSLLNGLNRSGHKKELYICDFLTFYEQYCSLTTLEPRIKYFSLISDAWINEMLMVHPFESMKLARDVVQEPPIWWITYNKVKHNFYSYHGLVTLESTVGALAGLISFTAVVPQVRRLLCDHGFIRDDTGKPVPLDYFGSRVNGNFKKDEWVRHDQLVFKDHLDDESLPPIACVSNLFVVPFVGDYVRTSRWSGLR